MANRDASRTPSRAPVLWAILYTLALAWILHAGWGRRAEWRTQLVDKGIGGDGIQYWQMAVHMERDHMVSLDGTSPTWYRLPGYPALLRLTTRPAESDDGPQDPKSIQRRVDAWLKRAVRVNLLVDLAIGVTACLVGWALGAGPVALLAAAAWAWQPWSSVIAIHTLSDPWSTLVGALCLVALARAVQLEHLGWFALAGALAGAAQYVRADSILLLPALVIGGLLTTGRGRWVRALVAACTFAVVFAPWPLRNHAQFGEWHPLGAYGLDDKGKPIDRTAAYAWMRTWCKGREYETVHIAWKLPGGYLTFANLPDAAYDNVDEADALRAFFRDYNLRNRKLDDDLTERLDTMAADRRARHPVDYWLNLPLARVKLRLLPPRDGYGLGTLPTIREHREQWERADRAVVIAGLLGLVLLLLRPQRRAAAGTLAVWLLLRLVLIGWIPAPEPRYLLEALPLIVAAASTVPASFAAALGALARRVRRSRQTRPRA